MPCGVGSLFYFHILSALLRKLPHVLPYFSNDACYSNSVVLGRYRKTKRYSGLRNGVNEMRQSSTIIHKGRKEEKYEIYIEDYVMSFLREEMGTLELSEFFFYGFREKDGKRYIIYGAGRSKDLEVFDKYSFLDEIGCRLTQAGPVFLVHENDDIYEVKGYEVFYQDNHEMQSYLIERKTESVDRGRNRPQQEKEGEQSVERLKKHDTSWQKQYNMRQRKQYDAGGQKQYDTQHSSSRYDAPGHKNPYSAVSLQLCIVLVALVAIVINSTNSYDKMQQLNQTAEEVFFAMENQEADKSDETGKAQDEIVVKRKQFGETVSGGNVTEEDRPQAADGSTAGEDESVTAGKSITGEDGAETADGSATEMGAKDHAADPGQEEDILKLVTLENEEQAGKQQGSDNEEQTDEQEERVERVENDKGGEAQAKDSAEAGEKDDGSSKEAGQDSDEAEEGVEALSRNVTRYYEVERGDTLYTISKKIYGDTSYVHKICELNSINDPDNIHYGQKIILP